MTMLQKFYKAEEQHVKKTVGIYSSLKNDLDTIRNDFMKHMEESKKQKPRRQFG